VKYIANPVEVDAEQIERIIPGSSDSPLILKLAGGRLFSPSREMMSRMTPTIGDYVVTQADGYIYLNPKDVFLRKYRLAE
jgi:hypothetical protein